MTTDPRNILALAKPVTRTAKVCVDGEVATELEELNARLRTIPESPSLEHAPERLEIERRIDALHARAEEATVPFVFRSIGKLAWSKLLAEHPPTEEQMRAQPGLDHNPETFPQAAIAASLVGPQFTAAQLDELFEVLSFGQFLILWNTCLAANLGNGEVPKSVRRSAVTPTSDATPTSAAPAGSPSPSSKVG